jgi:FdhD protein
MNETPLIPVPGAPRLTAASCDPAQEVEIVDEHGERRSIGIPAERPLTLLIDGRELVTLLTLGACPELLVLGYLHNQALIGSVTEIASIEVDWPSGTAAVSLRPEAAAQAKMSPRIVATGSGQSTVFNDLMNRIDSIRLPPSDSARIRQSTLYRLLETVRERDHLHRGTGSVHGCALFRGAEMLMFVEDVGRHNAMDAVMGWMTLHGVAGGDKILYSTGRLSGEMVMKAAQIGVPIVVSRNGVTAMGHDVARRLGMTLIGRAVKRRLICYIGAERFDAEPELRSAAPRDRDK